MWNHNLASIGEDFLAANQVTIMCIRTSLWEEIKGDNVPIIRYHEQKLISVSFFCIGTYEYMLLLIFFFSIESFALYSGLQTPSTEGIL